MKTPEQAHNWYVKKRQNDPKWRSKNAKAARAWRERKGEDPEWVAKERRRKNEKTSRLST